MYVWDDEQGMTKDAQLSKNEKNVYYNLVKYPDITDTELSKKIGLAQSTVTTIRHRLKEQGFYRNMWVPMLSKMGCEVMVVIHTNFNPVVPLGERIEKTRRTIESFEDLIFSIGEVQKGFSITISKNYTSVGRINDKRTELFSSLDLIEREYPREVVFPFEISKMYRFFNFYPYMEKHFGLGSGWVGKEEPGFQHGTCHMDEMDKHVLLALVENPDEKDDGIGKMLGVSRHTVSAHRKKLQNMGCISRLRLPDMRSIGIELLVLNHIKFNPSTAPSMDIGRDLMPLLSPSTIFMVSRKFEMVRLCAYPSYEQYKQDKSHLLTYLHRQKLLSETPVSRVILLESAVTIKDLEIGPLVNKILFEGKDGAQGNGHIRSS